MTKKIKGILTIQKIKIGSNIIPIWVLKDRKGRIINKKPVIYFNKFGNGQFEQIEKIQYKLFQGKELDDVDKTFIANQLGYNKKKLKRVL